MKVIDCIWENVNLDCRVAEVSILSIEDMDAKVLRDLESTYDYIVLKVPIKDPVLYQVIEELGYHFFEAQLGMQADIESFAIPQDARTQAICIEYQPIKVQDRNEWQSLLNQMTRDMYTTDRIALDTQFGFDYSLRRYRNWSMSEFDRGTDCIKMVYKGNVIGLLVMKVVGDVIHGLLTGLYTKYQHQGLGVLIPLAPAIYKGTGCRTYMTVISSNNLPVINKYIGLNYQVVDEHYVFVKHINE